VEAEGFEALAGGLQKTYRRGRQAMEVAYAEPTAEHFHEWRKRVKYHWYHSQLLQRIWPALMEPWTEATHNLADLLGDAHDLAVFRKTVLDQPERYGNIRSLSAFIGLLDRRRDELRGQARPLGQRLFAEKPAALSTRWERAWDVWRKETKASLPS
jgi:CHAD domain-containing protein